MRYPREIKIKAEMYEKNVSLNHFVLFYISFHGTAIKNIMLSTFPIIPKELMAVWQQGVRKYKRFTFHSISQQNKDNVRRNISKKSLRQS